MVFDGPIPHAFPFSLVSFSYIEQNCRPVVIHHMAKSQDGADANVRVRKGDRRPVRGAVKQTFVWPLDNGLR